MCNVHCIMMEIIDSNVKVPSLGGGNDIPNSILCCDIAVMPLETFAKDFGEAGAQPVHSVVHEASARALYCKMDLKINLVNLYFDRACTISVLISVPNALSFLAFNLCDILLCGSRRRATRTLQIIRFFHESKILRIQIV